MKPIVTHKSNKKDVWYSNDNDFKREFNGFNKNDQYIFRFSGKYQATKSGQYKFWTRSDDGSALWIGDKRVVNNDGNHGMRAREGRVTLSKGWHQIVITFYENGGGAGLQVQVARPGEGYKRLSAKMTKAASLPAPQGAWFEAYNWNGKSLTQMGNPNYAKWDAGKLIVAHQELSKAIWYSNDNDFKREIPKFSKNDRYAMRWAGKFNVGDASGKWQFKTRSDDGSQVWIDGKRVVNNDGNHGMRDATGAITLSKGWHQSVATFYENGGGAGMQVSVKGPGQATGGQWVKYAAEMSQPIRLPPAPPPSGSGMYFEAFHRKCGNLASCGSPHQQVWNNMKPIVTHKTMQKQIWYSSDNDFKREIKGFNKNDHYAMRWSGKYVATKKGQYKFWTRSDDGSMLYVNSKLIVNNDGDHGMRNREGRVNLNKGTYPLVITFYEKGGGAGLQVQVARPGEGWQRLSSGMTKPYRLPPPTGLYLEAYHWNGKSLTKMGNPNNADWDGQKPIVSHAQFRRNVWYSNDNDFKRAIPGFSKNDRYAMRFYGNGMLPNNGKYCFRTRSDDGSQLWVDGKRIVNNDGNHGMQNREGCTGNIKKGPHKIVITFYENGGGAGLQVSIKGPGFGWTRLTSAMTQPTTLPLAWKKNGNGMYFEAFNWNGKSLQGMGRPVYTKWDNQKPIVAHQALGKDIWYSNDNDFKREIKGFSKNDRYAMRWSGGFATPQAGVWEFKTRSDDGSQLWIDGKRVVNNDGNHGMRERQGKIDLTKGDHELVMTFYENGGGAGMQVSVKSPSGQFQKLTSKMTKARRLTPPQGMYLEAFNWNGKSLTKMGNPTTASWDGQKPIVAHSEFKKDVWYSNDNDFKREIPKFSKNDRYAMRWAGNFNVPKSGKYCIRTRSDDGSQAWVNGQRIVNNDGNHGMRSKEGCGNLKQGTVPLVLTFYENGGGAGMQVSVKGPGFGWRKLTRSMTSPLRLPLGWKLNGNGMYFEAWHRRSGQLSNWGNPNYRYWNPSGGGRIKNTARNLNRNVWYSNDNDFKKAIPNFNKNDQYIMRWSGTMPLPMQGSWCFWTRSDDGSQLWVDGARVVNNDGNHGMRERSGCKTLSQGNHELVITFYENGGGAGLQTKVKAPGGSWQNLDRRMTRATRLTPPQGMALEAYHWNGKSLGQSGNPTTRYWDGQTPIVTHPSFKKNLWYSNDNDFKRLIPGFSKNDKYAMRWAGKININKAGKYCIRTRSDDGSQAWVNGQRLVNNDGNHGMRSKEGCGNMKKGAAQLVFTFYENGGGAGMQVSVKGPDTGNKWVALSSAMTEPITLPERWNQKGNGLYFEAYDWNGKTLAQNGSPNYRVWNNLKPKVAHKTIGRDIWYSNDNDFKRAIPGFNKNDRYMMRWSGDITLPKTGDYRFRTRSDDGSQLWIDGVRIVNNDGNHGMRNREGGRRLRAGIHEIVITFYENGGGAGLQASVRVPGGNWQRINKGMCKAARLSPAKGLYLEAFHWGGKSLARMGNPHNDRWDKMTPIVAHSTYNKKDVVWYSNDNDFKRAIPGFSKNDKYAMRWAGQIYLPATGKYQIRTTSDDGSMAYLDKQLVVNNDGNHGMRRKDSKVMTAKKGWHRLVLTFYENGGGAGMQVMIKGPPTNNKWIKLAADMTRPWR